MAFCSMDAAIHGFAVKSWRCHVYASHRQTQQLLLILAFLIYKTLLLFVGCQSLSHSLSIVACVLHLHVQAISQWVNNCVCVQIPL